MESLLTCPVCKHTGFSEYLKVTDHFLSREQFTIVSCDHCGFRFTNPRPDKNEIMRYYESADYISHNAKKKDLLSWVYKVVRSVNVRNKYNLIKRHSKGNRLIDIGCGTGELLDYCSGKGYQVTGIEPNETARNFAVQTHGLAVYPESYLDDPGIGKYDIVTLWHVLEHVHELANRMQQIHKLLDKEGTLIIAVPDSDSWDAVHFSEYWAALDVPRHLYHFTPDTLKLLAENNGFRIVEKRPMMFDAYYISLISEKYKSGKQKFLNALLKGIKSNNSARHNNDNYSSLIYILKISEKPK
jgi:2-polyprenyl-3-methyl-5-hydroxy-6-metoxy-1,4-benzoquinol methylase